MLVLLISVSEAVEGSSNRNLEVPSMDKIARPLALLSAGLQAGAFLAAFFTVVPTWYEVPREVHFTYRVALMRHGQLICRL
jgi:hypothetical protein